MIVVGGFNTAVDKWMETEEVHVGGVVRGRGAHALPGGKGLHVAVAAAALGERVWLVGIIDQRRREWFESFLKERRILFEGIATLGEIRTCLAIQDSRGQVTEILEPGPELSTQERELLTKRLLARGRQAGILVLSGSIPLGLPETVYRDLIAELSASGVRCLLDASQEVLRFGLEARPFLLKQNREEAQALSRTVIDGPASAAQVAAGLAASGIPFVVISLGAEGVVASFDARLCHAKPPAVVARNPVGAGDCLLGGLAAGLRQGLDPFDAVKLGTACGTAKVLSWETGLLRRQDVEAILPEVEIRWLQ